MKAYTDIEQSKKLAEILPLESADMNWHELPSIGFFARAFQYKLDNGATEGLFPCWSLTALLSVLCRAELEKDYATWDDSINLFYRVKVYKPDVYVTNWQDNPVDACYEMILKLHELNLL
jgi:hypothetical protein